MSLNLMQSQVHISDHSYAMRFPYTHVPNPLFHTVSPWDVSEMLSCENMSCCMVSLHGGRSMTHAGMEDNFPMYPGNHEKKAKRDVRWPHQEITQSNLI